MTSKLKTKSTSSRVGGVSSPSPSPSSFDKIDELLTLSPEKISVIDYERELMKRRAHLLRCLKDPSIYQEFMRFMSNSKSTRFLFILNVLFMIFFIPTCTKLAAPSSTHGNIWFICEFLVEVSLTVTGWLLYGCLADESWLRPYSEWVREQTKMKTWDQLGDVLQSIFYISAVLVRALDLIQRVESGPCKDSSYLSSFSCNPNSKSDNFPTDSLIILMVMPIFFSCVLRETRIPLMLSAWCIVIFSLLYTSCILASSQAIAILVFYVIAGGLVILDSFKQCLLFYLLSRQLKKMIEANQRLAVQNKATEMRHLIANVAHDLKTPLSSFMTGIDIISADIIECMLKLKSSPHKPSSSMIEGTGTDQEGVTKEYLASMMSGLQSCIVNIRNTNAFMLMTINRCLDYTKASNGLKLVPKNETIDLQETINMPLQCMTNIQNKMKITLQPYEDEGICSHIITDRQWLQENLLCLLSNAVKYSGEGEVLIVVSRVTRALDRTVSGTKTNSPDDSDDYHPASPTKLCYRIEDEVITSEPDNYQSPVTTMLRQLSMAHISRKSTSSRLSMKSGQVSVMGSQWFREATSTNSRGLDVMLNSMVTRRSIINTNKVAPSPPTSPTRHTQRTVNSRQGMNQLENPSDNDSFQETEEYTQQRRRRSPRRHIPHRRMSTASNASVASQASQASSQAVSEKSFHEELMFEVIDPGIGIAEEAMKSLFNPFKQTQRLAGGTGLGLYSLAKRIEALKGKYGVHQRVDGKQGSVFWFTIPYRADTVTAAALMAVGGGGVGAGVVGGDKNGGLGVRESYDLTHGMMTSQLYKNAKSGDNNVNVMVDAGVQPQPTSIHASTPTTSLHQNQNLSVLIVEDTPSIAKMTSMMLKRQKHRTEVAENGQIALKMLYEEETKDVERFRKESKEGEGEGEGRVGGVSYDVNSEGVRYDVVLMDLQMPVMDGLEATRRIRGREKEKEKDKMTRHQIVIGVSANSDHETMEEAFKAGIDDFLPKPFSMEAFLKAVQRIQVKLYGASQKISQ